MTTTRRSPRDAAIAWQREQQELLCDDRVTWEHGVLQRASTRPSFWDYNNVYAHTVPETMTAQDLARMADEHHGDLAHRQVQVEDEAAGRRLRPQFEALGWKATPLVFMAHAGELPPAPEGLALREAPDHEAEPLRRRWYPEDEWARDPAVLEAFLREEREVHDILGGHVLLVDPEGGGAPVAYVRVRVGGDTGEVAEAYAIPEVRGRGIGGGLVAAGARAIAQAGVDHVLIVADGDGRPQRLYERLGFRPVWTHHQFLRLPKR